MQRVGTDPEINQAIIEVLRNYNQNSNFKRYISSIPPPHVTNCLANQAQMGWTDFLEGFLSQEWEMQQSGFYRSQNSQHSGNRWAVELSKRLWKMIFAMWDHRNWALFESEHKDQMSGLAQLKLAISCKLDISSQGLDCSFQPYFTFTTETFLKMIPLSLRWWFALICQAREDTGYSYNDDFFKYTGIMQLGRHDKTPSNPTTIQENPTRQSLGTGYWD